MNIKLVVIELNISYQSERKDNFGMPKVLYQVLNSPIIPAMCVYKNIFIKHKRVKNTQNEPSFQLLQYLKFEDPYFIAHAKLSVPKKGQIARSTYKS